ncbi:MAG TPA: hypothetical protein VLK22_01395 [Candidatus Udaeobacter sp.]|nr:hypothetical protein [Candidatus Udaeobacter sp.]
MKTALFVTIVALATTFGGCVIDDIQFRPTFCSGDRSLEGPWTCSCSGSACHSDEPSAQDVATWRPVIKIEPNEEETMCVMSAERHFSVDYATTHMHVELDQSGSKKMTLTFATDDGRQFTCTR